MVERDDITGWSDISRLSWVHHLLSDENPTCADLAEVYNDYLAELTSHFKPLVKCKDDQEIIPNHLLVSTGQVCSELRRPKAKRSFVVLL